MRVERMGLPQRGTTSTESETVGGMAGPMGDAATKEAKARTRMAEACMVVERVDKLYLI